MGFSFNIKKMTLGMKIIYSVVALGIVAAIVIAIIMSRSGYLANTMRLLRVEGTVKIESANGGSKPVINNIRFQSGDALSTGADGLASVGLDDTKIVTLQNDSRAEFNKNGKHLELKLTKGALFFNVTEKLGEDESFEIKTSTMTAGIRGTSGYVYYDDEGRDSLIITDGVVIVTAINPDTGETKYAEVRGGQKITVYLYSDRAKDSIEFILEDVSGKDLPDFILKMLNENEALLTRVCEFTGWDKEALRSLAATLVSAATDPGVTSTPVPTADATATPKPVNTATPTPSVSPALSAAPTPEPDETNETEETDATEAGATSTPTPVPKATSTPKPVATATPTTKPVAVATPKPTATATPVPTATNTPTPTSTPTPTPEPIVEPTETEEREIVGYEVTVEIINIETEEIFDYCTITDVPVLDGTVDVDWDYVNKVLEEKYSVEEVRFGQKTATPVYRDE